jgi:Uma2 family endonuclease
MSETKLYTMEEFVLDPELEHYELIAGEPRLRMTSLKHSRVLTRLITALNTYVTANRLGEVFSPSTGLLTHRNPDTVRIPDAMFVSAAAMTEVDMEADPALFKADLAVEILSKSNSQREMRQKIAEYFGIGVREIWIIDPKRQTLTKHRQDGTTQTYIATDVLDGGDVVPGFRYTLG